MVNCKPGRPSVEIIGENFCIEYKGENYPCRAIHVKGRVLYQIQFNKSQLYITKTINQHGVPFWTAIPQDLKLRRIVAQLGSQLEDHLIQTLCATTTVSK